MGHESCGAVTATYNEVIKGEKVTGNMESFVEKLLLVSIKKVQLMMQFIQI